MPTFIKELVEGFNTYVAEEGGPDGLIERLFKEGQHPKYLVFACADSRSAPENIFGLNGGDDFDMRWGGPFIPAFDESDTYAGMINDHLSLFLSKGIKEIAIIAHEDCAAAGNVAQTQDAPANTLQKIGAPFLKDAKDNAPGEDLHREVERQVVIKGLENLKTYACVQDALSADQIHLHGLLYAMGSETLQKYYPDDQEFRIIAGQTSKAEKPTALAK